VKAQIDRGCGYDKTIGTDGFPVSDDHPFSIESRKQEEREQKSRPDTSVSKLEERKDNNDGGE
jgi:hypothetical protein